MSAKETYRKTFLGILVTVVTIAFVAVMRRFLITLLLAAIFAAMLHPIYSRVLKLFRGRKGPASAATLLAAVIIVMVPLGFFVGVVVSQAVQVSEKATPWIQEQVNNPTELMRRVETLPGLDRLAPYRQQVMTKLGELAGMLGSFTVNTLSTVATGTFTFLLHFGVLLYAMFFFLMDGARFLDRIMIHMPLKSNERDMIIDRFVSVTRAALTSTLVVGVVQGALAGLALAVAGIPGAVFWGTLMAALSMIPGIGTAIVWLPAAIYLVMTERVVAGMLLIAFCAVIVGSVDNVLRPRLVGKDTKLHELVVLLSTLGGIMLLGAIGFIIGPVIAAVFITVWDIYTTAVRGSTVTPSETDSASRGLK